MKFILSVLVTFFACNNFIFCADEKTKQVDTYFIKDGFLKTTNGAFVAYKSFCNDYINQFTANTYRDQIKKFMNSLVLIPSNTLIQLINRYQEYLFSIEYNPSDNKTANQQHLQIDIWHKMENLVIALYQALHYTKELSKILVAAEHKLIKDCQNKNNDASKNYNAINKELLELKKVASSNLSQFEELISEYTGKIQKTKLVLGVKEEWTYAEYAQYAGTNISEKIQENCVIQ